MVNLFKKVFINEETIDLTLIPSNIDEHELHDITVIQEHGDCTVNIDVSPLKDSLSKINIRIFAENDASVNCVCSVKIAEDASGVDTDMQIRSWPFDNSRIQARPEMFVKNSNIKAAHGNAVGTLSDDERYYLHSKGIIDYKELLKRSLNES